MEQYYPPSRDARECKYWWFDAWDWLVNQTLRSAGFPPSSQEYILSTVEGGVRGRSVTLDPHVHTLFSHCSISQPDRIILKAAALGLGAIGIMDHHTVTGALDAMRCGEDLKRRGLLREDFLVIPGVELNSDVGHIGALFVEENLPEGLSPEETVRAIHEAGGLAIAVHPYHSTGIRDAVFDAPFDAVEVECGSVFDRQLVRQNADLASDPRLARIAKLGGSDAHYLNAVASCYTVLTLDEPTLESAKRAILDRRSTARSSECLSRMRRALGWVPKLR